MILFCKSRPEYKREAKKGFGNEIPKQVWAAAQFLLNERSLRAGRYAAYD